MADLRRGLGGSPDLDEAPGNTMPPATKRMCRLLVPLLSKLRVAVDIVHDTTALSNDFGQADNDDDEGGDDNDVAGEDGDEQKRRGSDISRDDDTGSTGQNDAAEKEESEADLLHDRDESFSHLLRQRSC